MDDQWVWGIDGGGSSTRGIWAGPPSAQQWAPETSGPSNILVVGRDRAFSAMDLVLRALEHRGPLGSAPGLVGLAGADRPWVRDVWEDYFRARGLLRVWIVGDYWLPWAAFTGGRDGGIAILGTGSIFFCVRGLKEQRWGGHGWKVGDTGSGLSLGQQAMKVALDALDELAAPTLLSDAALKFLGAADRMQLLANLYAPDCELRALADFAPQVFLCADLGDRASLDLLDREAAALTPSLERLLQCAGEGQAIGLAGGLSELWQPHLERKWAEQGGGIAQLQSIQTAPIHGAVLLGRKWEKEGRPYLR